jgi:hypothetical protein
MVATPSSHPGSYTAPLLQVVRLVLPLLTLAAIPAGAQIFKCTDTMGNVVYQNAPCPKDTKAGKVEIFDNSWTADRAEKDAAWQRHAMAHEVVAGMPLRWVREALGEPEQVRNTATAGADEVWLYNSAERSTQVGILGQQVLWVRETPMAAPPAAVAAEQAPPAAQSIRVAPDSRAAAQVQAAPQAPTATVAQAQPGPQARVVPQAQSAPQPQAVAPVQALAPTQAPAALTESVHAAQLSPKVSESRHGIARGQDCKQALAELGPPDRKREVPALDSASDPMTEYFYEPAGSADPTRTRVVCANGKVEGVDRTVIR